MTEDSNPTSYEIKGSGSSSKKDFLDKLTSSLQKLNLILIPTAGGVLAWLAVMLFLGMLNIVLFAGQALFNSIPRNSCSYSAFLSIMGVGFLIAWSSFISGALLGFIFGIPRILPQESRIVISSKPGDAVGKKESHSPVSTDPYDTQSEKNSIRGELYGENSNVDQISDWLTKILVGAGLTQLTHIPEALHQYSEDVKPALGGFSSSGIFGTAILIFFLIDGFLIGYLWTRRSAAAELTKARYEK